MKGLSVAGSFVLGVSLAGCGRAPGEPARFTGRLATAKVSAANVRTVPSRPLGYQTLGAVVARCRADDGIVAFERESLADVDCSDGLLEAALREKAAAVGGELLFAVRCVEAAQSAGDLWSSTLHTCSAKVAAPTGAASPPAPQSDDSPPMSASDIRSPAEAFRVQVSFLPVDEAAARRRAKPADRVAELAVVPPGRVPMGDIVARCREDCDRDAVRYAVRAAAGRVGASDVVGIACIRHKDGYLCTGRATRPEVDEM